MLGAGVGCLLTFEMKEPEWVRVTPSEGLERVATLGSALDGRVEYSLEKRNVRQFHDDLEQIE